MWINFSLRRNDIDEPNVGIEKKYCFPIIFWFLLETSRRLRRMVRNGVTHTIYRTTFKCVRVLALDVWLVCGDLYMYGQVNKQSMNGAFCSLLSVQKAAK